MQSTDIALLYDRLGKQIPLVLPVQLAA